MAKQAIMWMTVVPVNQEENFKTLNWEEIT
jgi:hypothetical protein